MILSLQSAASGMEAQQINLNTISNNLANVGTTGFKKSHTEFQDLMYTQLKKSGAEAGGGNTLPTGVEVGNGTQVVSTTKVFSQGQLTYTGGRLDIAIEGDGFFEVEKPDGTLAYTRDGNLKVDQDGQVVTNDGYELRGFQAIPPEATNVTIASDGTVSIETPDGDPTTFRIELVRFNNPAGLESLGGNIYAETESSGPPNNGDPGEQGFGSIQQGYLETSNVNVAEEMVKMILAQRAYESMSKALQTSDEMLGQINQLKRT